MWFLRKATGTVLHNLELFFRGKKKIRTACVFFSKRIRPNGVIPYLATGKKKLSLLKKYSSWKSSYHWVFLSPVSMKMAGWTWLLCCRLSYMYARICSSVLVTQRASDLRIIQALQKSRLQLDLATFSRSNSFPLMWLLTEETVFHFIYCEQGASQTLHFTVYFSSTMYFGCFSLTFFDLLV